MKLLTLYLPEKWVSLLDEIARDKYQSNRSEVLRVAIRDFLLSEGQLIKEHG